MPRYGAGILGLASLILVASACSEPNASQSAAEYDASTTTVARSAAAPTPSVEELSTPLSAVRRARSVNPSDYERSSWTTGPMNPTPGVFSFTTPSGNITCTWEQTGGDTLVCGLQTRLTEPAPRPASCEDYLSWNTKHVMLTAAGSVDGVCAGGVQVPSQANELPYGFALIAGDFGCLSEEIGITCVNMASGRGFFVSRERFAAY